MAELPILSWGSADLNQLPCPYVELNVSIPAHAEDPQNQCRTKIPKSVNYTYSPLLKKTFVRRTAMVPFSIKTNVAPPLGSILRVQCLLKEDTCRGTVIRRCSKHLEDDRHDGHCAPNHFVRANSPHALYLECPQTGHLQIVLPSPTDFATIEALYFVCGTSCLHGKKQIQVVFTLESNTGFILGSTSLDLHICASPGRDREKHERALESKKGQDRGRAEEDEKEDETYILKVRGRRKYEILKKLKLGLDLVERLEEHESPQTARTETKDACAQTELLQVRYSFRRVISRVFVT